MMILICVVFVTFRWFFFHFFACFVFYLCVCLGDGCSINLSHYLLLHFRTPTLLDYIYGYVLKTSLEDYQILYHFFSYTVPLVYVLKVRRQTPKYLRGRRLFLKGGLCVMASVYRKKWF